MVGLLKPGEDTATDRREAEPIDAESLVGETESLEKVEVDENGCVDVGGEFAGEEVAVYYEADGSAVVSIGGELRKPGESREPEIVEFGDPEDPEEMELTEAVRFTADAVTRPGWHGLASAERVDVTENAVEELAEAVETVGQVVAEIEGKGRENVISLDGDAFGDIYSPDE